LKRLFTLSGFKIALFITLLVMGLFMLNTILPSGSFLNLLDKKWVDYIMRDRPVQPHTSEVAIATIDTKSVDKYGRWPWPRTRLADLVRALNDHYKVSTIGFDIVFSEAEEDSGLQVTEQYRNLFSKLNLGGGRGQEFLSYLKKSEAELDRDGLLGKELARRRNTVLGYFFFTSAADLRHVTEQEKLESAQRVAGSEISLIQGNISPGVIPIGVAVESNIEKIFRGGYLSGFFNMNPDPEDGTVRRVHLLMQYQDNVFPSLDLQILRHYYHADQLSVIADENGFITQVNLGDKKKIFPQFDGSIMLNYKGGIQTFPHYSIYDIIEHQVPLDKLKDKIVLVGATEVGIFDLRTAPVSVAYPGVEVHATLLDNVLTDSYFRLDLANDMMTLLLILVIGLFLGFTLPHVKGVYGLVIAGTLVVAYALAHRWMVNNLLTWTSFIYPAMVVALVWGAVTLFRFLVTDKDKRFIRGAFQQYLAPEVINQLMENPDLLKLGGERQVVTAFFSDVQGFSTFSEKLEPEALVQLMQEYLTEMSNIVMKHGGTIDKYIGDAIVAFFGAPIHYEDHPAKACVAAMEMQARLEEMRTNWRSQGKQEDMMLYQRIGLNTGPMVVGNMGSDSRFNYTMMGNAVNLAARLEGANKFYGTYSMCSEYTYAGAKDAVEGRELDAVAVKGISKPVRIFQVLGKKGEIPEEKLKGVQYYEKGLELYRKRQFEEAAKYFNAVYKFIPEDPPARTMIARCKDYLTHPPDDHWDGSYHATEK
jgi:adenylate cyclase